MATGRMIYLRPEVPLFAGGIIIVAQMLARYHPSGLFLLCTLLAPLLAKASLVILYLGHATNFTEALFLANRRGIGIAFHSMIYFVGSMAILMGVTMGVYNVNDPQMVWRSLIIVAIAGYPVSSIWLAPIIATVGTEEEPGYRVPRSHRLVSVGRIQAIVSIVGFTTVQMIMIRIVQNAMGNDPDHFQLLIDWVLPLFGIALSMVFEIYWFLFYIEAKQALEAAGWGIVKDGPSKEEMRED